MYVISTFLHRLYATGTRDLVLQLFNLKSGLFPGNNNLHHEVITKYSLSLLDQASAIENLTAENCSVVDLVNIKNSYPV